eukprot:TRINITY_DN25708_c0_g1_i1.p1 TRINITY_DN25708_c0_g1~~TRINITY_DN25708_c0_g1_i1.p1  ORF type:complete len:384 (+),score=31.20 TRINITY_DN25708_c0_g1_i1:677-1828(+)
MQFAKRSSIFRGSQKSKSSLWDWYSKDMISVFEPVIVQIMQGRDRAKRLAWLGDAILHIFVCEQAVINDRVDSQNIGWYYSRKCLASVADEMSLDKFLPRLETAKSEQNVKGELLEALIGYKFLVTRDVYSSCRWITKSDIWWEIQWEAQVCDSAGVAKTNNRFQRETNSVKLQDDQFNRNGTDKTHRRLTEKNIWFQSKNMGDNDNSNTHQNVLYSQSNTGGSLNVLQPNNKDERQTNEIGQSYKDTLQSLKDNSNHSSSQLQTSVDGEQIQTILEILLQAKQKKDVCAFVIDIDIMPGTDLQPFTKTQLQKIVKQQFQQTDINTQIEWLRYLCSHLSPRQYQRIQNYLQIRESNGPTWQFVREVTSVEAENQSTQQLQQEV